MNQLRVATWFGMMAVASAGLGGSAPPAAPPVAKTIPYEVPSPNGARLDPYYWLRDDQRQDPDVLAYLRDENAYADVVLAPIRALTEELFTQLRSHIQEDDATVPVWHRGYWYYSRFETGRDYAIHVRKRGSLDAPEEILLDGNALAEGHAYFRIGSYRVSPDNRLLAYTVDTQGRNQFVARIRNLDTGELLPDEIPNVQPDLLWADDNRTLLTIAKHPVTLLGYQVRAHTLGQPAEQARLIHEEKDQSFYLSLNQSKCGRHLFIELESTLVSEWHYARADDASLRFTPVLPREPEHLYDVQTLGDDFILRTNLEAPNHRLVRVPIATSADKATWQEIVPHRSDVFIGSFEVYRDAYAVNERSGGLRKVRVRSWDGAIDAYLDADEPAYAMTLSTLPDEQSRVVRYVYSSPATPATTFELDWRSGERRQLKQVHVPGGFDSSKYATEFIWAQARDGTAVPVSLVYRRGTPRDGSAPLLQYGYGSYGHSIDPTFSSDRLPLLDRGFVYAIAHIRGGQEMGRSWYEEGKLLRKVNTFTDFIDVTEHLVAQGYAARDRVYAMGGSAGGLLMGAVINLRPDLYRGVAAHVPFVDVVTTMLDESIPLTTNEFDEWGNPQQAAYYEYMKRYSPYDNVTAQAYPALLVTTGLWDSQVQYWEPAKWVARLRATQTGRQPLVFVTNLDAGHGGHSGRFKRLREIARDYAFFLGVEQGLIGPRPATAAR